MMINDIDVWLKRRDFVKDYFVKLENLYTISNKIRNPMKITFQLCITEVEVKSNFISSDQFDDEPVEDLNEGDDAETKEQAK